MPSSHSDSFLRGAARSLATIAAFLTFGLGLSVSLTEPGASTRANPGAGRAPYTPPMAPDPSQRERPPPRVWLVDGFNVLQVGLLGGQDRSGWWREAGRARVIEAASRFEDAEAEVWVVFDGPRPAPEPPEGVDGGEARVRVVFAPSADAWLLDRVRRAAGPGEAMEMGGVAVVTADRSLAGRTQHRGARVVAPGEFLARCTGSPEPQTG